MTRTGLSRRNVVQGTIGLMTLTPSAFAQQTNAMLGTVPSVITNPPRQWGHHAPPTIFPDPDVIVIDNAFRPLLVGNAAIHRVGTGFQWA